MRGRPIRHGPWELAGDRSVEGFIRIRLTGQFDQAEDFSDGLAAVRLGGKWGYIDRTGRVVIAPRFIRVEKLSSGIARRG